MNLFWILFLTFLRCEAEDILLEQIFYKNDRLIDSNLPVILPFGTAQRRQYYRRGTSQVFFRPEVFVWLLKSVLGESSTNIQAAELGVSLGKYQDLIPDSVPFPCSTDRGRSRSRPAKADRLRPGDIDVIAAIGDSLTAGSGIGSTNLLQVFVTNGGLSHLIGGQGTWRQYLTLPNILKMYNPNLIGYAVGDSLYSAKHKRSGYNLAVPGSVSLDTYTMAQTLVSKLKSNQRINFSADWKMISIFIGSVDICLDVCYWRNPWSTIERHRLDLEMTLNYLKVNSPRTFVNLIILPNLFSILSSFKKLPLVCEIGLSMFCPCLKGPVFRNKRKYFEEINKRWQQVQYQVGTSGQYRTEDFVVVPQTYLSSENFKFPEKMVGNEARTDLNYLAEDCFHISQRGHSVAANAVWNNLLEPRCNKTKMWRNLFDEFKCPTSKFPFFRVD